MLSDAHREVISNAIYLDRLPWPEVQAVRDESPFLLLPIGATEQHGPHLPINTDSVIASNLGAYASGKARVGLLPTMTYGVSTGHSTKWPGTFSLVHETFIAAVSQVISWAVATGWKRVILLNSHFGNDASLRVAVDQLRLKFLGRLQIAVQNSFQLSPEIWNYFISDAEDLHANKGETDLMLYLAPDTVRMNAVEDDPDRTCEKVFSYPVCQTSLNGVTGASSEGTSKAGGWLFGLMGDALADILQRASDEEPPLPKDEWLGTGYDFST